MLASYIAVLLAGIATYIGALWTLESQLWGRSLLETMLILGNNGRYATAVLLPLVFLCRGPLVKNNMMSHNTRTLRSSWVCLSCSH